MKNRKLGESLEKYQSALAKIRSAIEPYINNVNFMSTVFESLQLHEQVPLFPKS